MRFNVGNMIVALGSIEDEVCGVPPKMSKQKLTQMDM
jgi:hypothetical protein